MSSSPEKLTGRFLYAGAIVTICTTITFFAWNIALTPMFSNLPDLKFGNLFVVYCAIFFIKNLLSSPLVSEINDRIEHLDTMFKTIHANDLAQRKGILELLSIINNKIDGQKTVVKEEIEQ